MSDHDLARQIAALRTELREVRRLVTELHGAATRTPPGPDQAHVDDRGVFLPGTGWLDR